MHPISVYSITSTQTVVCYVLVLARVFFGFGQIYQLGEGFNSLFTWVYNSYTVRLFRSRGFFCLPNPISSELHPPPISRLSPSPPIRRPSTQNTQGISGALPLRSPRQHHKARFSSHKYPPS